MFLDWILRYFRCVQPSIPLRRQLVYTYGSIAVLSMTLAVTLAALSSLYAGNAIKKNGQQLTQEQQQQYLTTFSIYHGQIIKQRLESYQRASSLIVEFVRDRIVGYSEQDTEWYDDAYVPFDFYDNNNKDDDDDNVYNNHYPFHQDSSFLRRDFQVANNLQDSSSILENLQEQSRADYWPFPISTTDYPSFFFAGNCNPEIQSWTSAFGYYENCTMESNIPPGKVHPNVMTTAPLLEKSADIAVYFKPIFESLTEATSINVYYVNSGAGAQLQFPTITKRSWDSYESQGCDWLKNEINPFTKRPFSNSSTDNLLLCAPKGTRVMARNFNPLEFTTQCKDQALHANQTRIYGPFKSLFEGHGWYLSIGQAIFDRLSQELIGHVAIDIPIPLAANIFDVFSLQSNTTDFKIVRRDGTIVYGGGEWTGDDNQELKKYDNAVDEFSSYWWSARPVDENGDAQAVIAEEGLTSKASVYITQDLYLIVEIGAGRLLSSIIVNNIKNEIDIDVEELIFYTAIFGCVGLCLVILTLWLVSRALTLPLQWIEAVSTWIVHHAKQHSHTGSPMQSQQFRRFSKTNSVTEPASSQHEDEEINDSGSDKQTKDFSRELESMRVPSMWCTPTTEITLLVFEFRRMIRGFSGSGASTVAQSRLSEVFNRLVWQDDYMQEFQSKPAIGSKKAKRKASLLGTFANDRSVMLTERSTAFLATGNDHEEGNHDKNNDNDNNHVNGLDLKEQPQRRNTVSSLASPSTHTMHRTESVSRVHCGTLLMRPLRGSMGGSTGGGDDVGSVEMASEMGDFHYQYRTIRSSLFYWIVALIVLPLVLTNAAICFIVAGGLNNRLPDWISLAEVASYNVELDALVASANLRALFAESILREPLLNLHLFSRVAGWTIFDAIERNPVGFPKMETEFVEECKEYPPDDSCPFFTDTKRNVCDCKFNDGWGRECRDYPSQDTRYLQKTWVVSQSRDAHPTTGYRNSSTTFMNFMGDGTPRTTAWWYNVTHLPGVSKGSNASGYRTTYDRFRVISAMSAVSFPIYNYINAPPGNPWDRTTLSSYFSFEPDGIYWGYAGCYDDIARYAHFLSSEGNRAAEIRPQLCPLGKYGYDPRCRGWYEIGIDSWESHKEPMYVTPPYRYAADSAVGTSAGAVLVNPDTNEVIGQTSIDLSMQSFFIQLVNRTKNVQFSFLITPRSELDTVVGPNYPAGDPPAAIAQVVLPYDGIDSNNYQTFTSKFVTGMKQGGTGHGTFYRNIYNDEKGEFENEQYVLSYAPIVTRLLTPTQPNDFARGANLKRALWFSVGVVRKEQELRLPFKEIEEKVEKSLSRLANIYIGVVVALTLMYIAITVQVTIAVSKPILVLLRVVQKVNEGKISDRLPALQGGSAEVNQVYNSFAKLNRIVSVSTRAFYSGNYRWAFEVMQDALVLFRKVNDQKAIGIACNNLGNTLFALSRENPRQHECHCVNGVCCVRTGLRHYSEAISIASHSFERTTQTETKAWFGQQLADRLFNRAIFLLHSLDDPCCPSNARDMAFNDLVRGRELDQLFIQFALENKLLTEMPDMLFDRILRRLYGMTCMIPTEPKVSNVWDASELVAEADQLLAAYWGQSESSLFRDLGNLGRLQQIEAAAISLELISGKPLFEAARIGMRMLAEDEYLVDSAFIVAAEAMLCYMKDDTAWNSSIRTSLRRDLLKMLSSCKASQTESNKSLLFCFDIGKEFQRSTMFLSKLNMICMDIFNNHCREDDWIGIFGDSDVEQIRLPCEMKSQNRLAQKEALERVTTILPSHGDGGSGYADGKEVENPQPIFLQAIASLFTQSDEKVDNNDDDRDGDDGDATKRNINVNNGQCTYYVVWITDGEGWDEATLSEMYTQVVTIEQERNIQIDILVIGLEMTNDNPVRSQLLELCLRNSGESLYLDATRNTIEKALHHVNSIISSRRSFESVCFRLGITMEKF